MLLQRWCIHSTRHPLQQHKGSDSGAVAGQRRQQQRWRQLRQRTSRIIAACCRWVMPFSRQHTLTALSFMPLVPWALKVKLVQVGASGHCRALRGGSRPVCECARGAGSSSVHPDAQASRRASNLPPPAPQWWLKKFFFNPVGLGNMPPTGPLDEQDWAGGWALRVLFFVVVQRAAVPARLLLGHVPPAAQRAPGRARLGGGWVLR